MDSWLHDIRLAARSLARQKTFAATVLVTFAVCIGANAALFTVVRHVVLRPLPFRDADRLVVLGNAYPGAGVGEPSASGVPDYFDRLREMTVFDAQAMYSQGSQTVGGRERPERVRVMSVTPSWFRVLQVSPAIGRPFTEEEGEVGREREAILSYPYWQSAFGGDPAIAGREIRIDGQVHTIVGVMPQGFAYLKPDVSLWRPLAFTDKQKADSSRHSNSWTHLARLKPGATVVQAQAEVDALNTRNLERFPQYKQLLMNARFHTVVQRLQDAVVHAVRPTLFLLWGGALFVLLIGAVNVANLILVRSRSRSRELATRIALGADRSRVARQLVTESLVLAMAGAVVGLMLGAFALRAFGAVAFDSLPRGTEIRLDGVVVAYTFGLAALVGLAIGLMPLAGAMPTDVVASLREEGRAGTAGLGARTLRRTLVVAQVAFAFVLLTGAGLLFASFRHVLAIDPGFRPGGVMTAAVVLPRARYGDDVAQRTFAEEVLRRVRALPGVVAAGGTSTIPLGGDHDDSVILAEGYQMSPGESVISPSRVTVTSGYFEAMGVALVRGRFFDARDGADAPKVVIVDETLARRFWPNQDPIGRRMYMPTDINNLLAVTDKTVFLTVVGVVHDVKLDDLVTPKSSVGAYYFPSDQQPTRGLVLAARTAGDPSSLDNGLREAIASVDRELAAFQVRPMTEWMNRALLPRRSPVQLALAFGAVALFLSSIGVYGVLAYLVVQRTREIGIRIALGSSAAGVMELVMREGALLVGAGLALGLAGSLALRRTLESQLVDVGASDPVVLMSVVALLAGIALVACGVPAFRASRIDPIVALSE